MKKRNAPRVEKTNENGRLTSVVSVSSGSAIWQPANTAPKDAMILADFGWPWPTPARWSAMSESWATVMLNVGSDVSGNANDAWFETEYERPDSLRQWMPMPSLPNTAVTNFGANKTQ